MPPADAPLTRAWLDAPRSRPLTDEGVPVSAVRLGVDFCGVGHELAGVLHVGVREQGVMRGLLVRTARVVLRGTIASGRGVAEM